MPPRKRRYSTHSEDTQSEVFERQQSSTGFNVEVIKGKGAQKVLEGCTPERKLTARQQSRQDAQHARQDGQPDQSVEDKQQDNAMPSSTAETAAKQPTRFSTRVVKRPRRDLSPPESPVKKAGKKVAAPTPVTTPETKGKRTWELWSVEDKDSFFEGLCEFGKDFESIHNLIVSKCRKKGSVMPITVKNKEQVRHFYYRTWHKISKLIQPVEDLKKDIQELYGLISYSVLRKKLRGGINPNDKNWQKLNELVHQGAATIKVKGKRIRVKTPVCAALKRLNSYEEPKREPGPKLPEKIRVEFRPKSNAAWKQVQDLSQNPRLRICVKPDRNVESLIKFLDQKWTPQRLKSKASMNEVETLRQEFRVYPHRECVIQNINLEAVDDPVVHFCLKDHNKEALNISPSSIRRRKEKEACKEKESCASNKGATDDTGMECSSEADKAVITNCKCCVKNDAGDSKLCNGSDACECRDCCGVTSSLQACCNTSSELTNSASCNGCLKQTGEASSARVSLFSAVTESENTDSCKQSIVNTPVPVRTLDSDISAAVHGENAMFPDNPFREEASETGTQDNANDYSHVKVKGEHPERNMSDMENDLDSPVGRHLEIVNDEEASSRLSESSSQFDMERFVKDVMSTGWKVGGDEKLTVAELYLMFGKNGELKLEYEWVHVKSRAEILHEKLLHNLNNMLRRLSHLATVEFTDFTKTPGSGVSCQLCGQVQGAKPKSAGKSKDKSPAGKGRTCKPGKDAATQTLGPLVTKELPMSPASAVTPGQDGVFRVPVVSQGFNLQTKAAVPGKPFVHHPPPNKPIMRPRKLKPVSRGQARPPNNFAQRTILPKNSQLVTFYPVVAGPQMPGQVCEKDMVSQTIVGHPINGIQSEAVAMTTTITTAVPSLCTMGNAGDLLSTSLTSCQTQQGMVEISLSPDDDHTLMRIPASQVGSMSEEMLQAAGLSAVPTTSVASPLSIATSLGLITTITHSLPSSFTTPVSTHSSLSPPNLSSLLDMSLSNIGTGGDSSKFMDMGDTTFSSLLGEDTSKGLPLDPVMTTPPLRVASDHPSSSGLHSPPVQSLFTTSPTPDNQWLNGEAPDLSLTSFLESKPSISSWRTPGVGAVGLPLSLFSDCSRDSQSNKIDVDSTFQSMMNENSMEYVKKFADLAEEITAQNDVVMIHNRRTQQNSSVT